MVSQAGIRAACVSGRPPSGCLRLLERVVGEGRVQLTTRVPEQVAASCRAAARATRLAIACPVVVPAGGVVADRNLYGPQIVSANTYSVSLNNGQNPGRIHWEFGAIRGPARRLWVFDRGNWAAPPSTPPANRIGQRRYLGYRITLYRFPDQDGQLEGHDAAIASKRGISYFVSLHGHADDRADIAILVSILSALPGR